MKNFRKSGIAFLLVFMLLLAAGCGQQAAQGEKPTIILSDAGWDSLRFHNDVAALIIENGYGYKTEVTTGSTPVVLTGLKNGDIDILMEVWVDTIKEEYEEMIKNNQVEDLSVNFGDSMQGIYVPTYVIEGDPARGISPMAPDLKSITDLPKYKGVFPDAEDNTKGRIYGSIPGWAVDEIITKKIENYGLDQTFNIFRPGSDTALSTSLVQAYEKGIPWVGYYWEPTWIIGKYDMTLLEEPPYDEKVWNESYLCAFPLSTVTIGVNKGLNEKAPDIVSFLKNYKTDSALTSEALAYMQDNGATSRDTAIWFLKENRDLWTRWVPADVAGKVEAAIK